jgi:hypothetical protein
MVALTKALADALKGLRQMTGDQVIAAFPKEMTAGLDEARPVGGQALRIRSINMPLI